MIIKARRRGGFKKFSDYLQGKDGNEHENEQVYFIASNTSFTDINNFCVFASDVAAPTRGGRNPVTKPIEHIAIRTRNGDILTPEAIQSKLPELLKRLGYEDCPWLLVQHVKDGEPHYHLGILRIDSKGKLQNPKSKEICFELAQKFATELGFKASFNQANGDRHVQQKAHLSRLWDECKTLGPPERLRKFRSGGFTPARGDRGQLVFVDRYGKPHSLYRIPAVKAEGLKQADFPAAFGLNVKQMKALPTVKAAQANIRRIHNVKRTTTRLIRSFGKVARLYRNALSSVRGGNDLGHSGGTSGLTMLALLRRVSRSPQRDELRQIRGAATGQLVPARLHRHRPSPLHATRGWWVEARADGVYRSLVASGATHEEADKAVDLVYTEEDQRMAAEKRYLDWLQSSTGTPLITPKNMPPRSLDL